MPANSIDFYLQDARNNFDSVRPAPVCLDPNQVMGPCPNIHISTNCYYGYHAQKNTRNHNVHNDYEMMELPPANFKTTNPLQTNSRKRSAEHPDCLQTKRLRAEVQRKKTIEPETSETLILDTSAEHLEFLYWNTHGGNLYNYKQC